MGTDISTKEHVETLLRKFRGLVLGLTEEHGELKEKVHRARGKERGISTSTTTTTTNSTTSAVAAAPRTNSETFSTSTATSNSTRPPPYNNLVRNRAATSTSTRTTSSSLQTNYSSTTAATTASIMSSPTTARAVSRGALIVLEGLDRVGKSTLAKKLVEHLERGKGRVCMYRFPDRTTPSGKLINDYLKNSAKLVDDHTLHLLFSANRWEVNKEIRSTLNSGISIIVDRYSYTGIAYSSAKKGISMDWCCETEKGLPKPDLVIYLELSEEGQLQRTGFGDERFETKEFQELVRHQYERLIDRSCETWVRVNVEDKSSDQVLTEVMIPIRRALERASNKPVGDLDFRKCANI